MKITERQLRRIIKEELTKENQGMNPSDPTKGGGKGGTQTGDEPQGLKGGGAEKFKQFCAAVGVEITPQITQAYNKVATGGGNLDNTSLIALGGVMAKFIGADKDAKKTGLGKISSISSRDLKFLSFVHPVYHVLCYWHNGQSGPKEKT